MAPSRAVFSRRCGVSLTMPTGKPMVRLGLGLGGAGLSLFVEAQSLDPLSMWRWDYWVFLGLRSFFSELCLSISCRIVVRCRPPMLGQVVLGRVVVLKASELELGSCSDTG